MAKSQQTFNKSEKEKKRLKKRDDKRKKMEARKQEREENGTTGIPIAYLGHDGQLTDTPPDPSLKVKIKAKNIEIGVPKQTKEDREVLNPVRKGKVSYFDASKGYGFIIDDEDQEKYFTHVSAHLDTITDNDKVLFELEKGLKGLNAIKVQIIK